jgi:hypothetical protein
MTTNITARIERRTWYVDGKYLGDSSPFVADSGETAANLTGDFYGEWQGTRRFDGEQILREQMDREIENRRQLLANRPGSTLGESPCYPCRLSDFGEYRIITNAEAA